MTEATTRMQFASAISDLTEIDKAVDQVTAELSTKIDRPTDLVVVFATAPFGNHVAAIGEAFARTLRPSVTLVATCQGVIGVGREVEEDVGLSALAATLTGATIEPFLFEKSDLPAVLQSPEAMRERICPHHSDPRAIVAIADPFSTPQQEWIDALDAAFPGVPVIGGMASAAHRPGDNRLLLNDRVTDEGVIGFAIGGEIDVGCTVSQGCRPVGEPFVITKADGHVLHELGRRNALQVVHEVVESLSEEDQHLVANHALFVGRVINEYKDHFGRGDFLIRNIVGVDREAGHIAVGDPHLRAGQTIQFQVRDGQTATEDFRLLLDAQKLYGPASGALLASCNGRGTHMFGRPDADAEMIRSALGDLPLAGFFAMGEIGPIGGRNHIHGHTASLIVFRPLHESGE